MTKRTNARTTVNAWSVIEPYWDRVDIYGSADKFLRAFAKAPPPVGHLLATHWCYSEVSNGGFHQFFSNPTGVLAPEAAAGFAAIGQASAAKIVEQAMAMFGRVYPRDRGPRLKILATLELDGDSRKEWDPFHPLDGKFDRATKKYESAADAYAARNAG